MGPHMADPRKRPAPLLAFPLLLASSALVTASDRAPAQCVTFGPFTGQGNLPTNLQPPRTATQISGMAASRHNPGVLWIHDDGDVGGTQVIAIRGNGALAQQYALSGVTNRDWEDIALGPGPIRGRDYFYVADTGNNSLSATSFQLVRAAEPDVPATPGALISLPAEVFRFRYPSGTFNAETLWIDPVDGTPYVLTKENLASCSLFRYPLPLDPNVEKTLVLEARLQAVPAQFTGGAVSADGRWVLARTNTVVCAWWRPAGMSLASALQGARCTVSHQNGLAESISVAADGRSLWAISEGSGAVVANSQLGFPGGVPVHFAFGTGLGGAAGVPGLAATVAPRLAGPLLEIAGWQALPSAPAVLLLSTTGYPDGQVPFAGGWLHAAPDVVLPARIAPEGTWALPVGVLPDVPALYGAAFSGQLLVADPAAVQGIALSAGLRLVLDR